KRKWRDLVTPGTPLPTPWDKDEYERNSQEVQTKRRALRAKDAAESEMNKLLAGELDWSTSFLGGQKFARAVGAFEGASYEPKGLYRPEVDCVMFTRDKVGFCRVCQRAIARIIDMHSR
ncbi:MAG: peptidase M64, partial [Acidobacteria bacterium]